MIDVNEEYFFNDLCGNCKYFSPVDKIMGDILRGYCEVDGTPTFSNTLSDCCVKDVTWILKDETNGTGVCSNCHRQDHIDPLASYCRYCGSKIRDIT